MTKSPEKFLNELKKTLKEINKYAKEKLKNPLSMRECDLLEGQTNMAKFVINKIQKFQTAKRSI